MPLTDIATIVVSTTSAGVTRAGYGVPMILSHTAAWSERIRFYTSITAVGADFAANTPEYLAANKIFGQSPKVTRIAIGRAALAPQQTYSLWLASGSTGTANQEYKVRVAVATGVVFPSQDATYKTGGATYWQPSMMWSRGDLCCNAGTGTIAYVYSCLGPSGAVFDAGFTGFGGSSGPTGTSSAFRENGVYWMYVGTGGTGTVTNDAVMNGLKSRIEYLGSPTVVGTGTLAPLQTTLQGSVMSRTLQLQLNTAGKFAGVQVYNRAALGIQQTQADPGVATDLTAIKNSNNSWYGLVTVFNSEGLVNAAAAWVEANTKLYGPAVQDTAIPQIAASTATDAAHDFKVASYARSWVFAHPSPDEFADAAEMGKFFPKNPGSETWRMKTLTGVTEETYSDTEVTNMEDKRASFYYDLGGVGVVGGDAVTGSGEYIDVTRFLDWYTSELQAKIANLAIQSDKIPFTNPGIDSIEAKVVQQNKAGIRAGGIAPGTDSVTAPDVNDISTEDKQARELADVVSTFDLAGAIHHTTVTVYASA